MYTVAGTSLGARLLLIHQPASRLRCFGAYAVGGIRLGAPVLCTIDQRFAFYVKERIQSEFVVKALLYCFPSTSIPHFLKEAACSRRY